MRALSLLLLLPSLALGQGYPPPGGSGSGITLGAFGSSPDAKGATLSAGVLTLQPADATHPGLVTTGAQTWAGAKTFTGNIVGTFATPQFINMSYGANGIQLAVPGAIFFSDTGSNEYGSVTSNGFSTVSGKGFGLANGHGNVQGMSNSGADTVLRGTTVFLQTLSGGASLATFSAAGGAVFAGGIGLGGGAVGTTGIRMQTATNMLFANSAGTFQFSDGSVNQLLLNATTATFSGGTRATDYGSPTASGGTQGMDVSTANTYVRAAAGGILNLGVNGTDYLSVAAGSVNFGAVATTSLLFASTDSSGSPGAATIDKATGRSAVASGAQSVVITDSACLAATSRVLITPRAIDTLAPLYTAIAGSGSFTVRTYNTAGIQTNVGANWAFDWACFN